MYLLKKVIQIRENSHPDHEKPFLEHLEDLRVMVTRVVITLLVSTILCFAFQKKLMEVLLRPLQEVEQMRQQEKLPVGGSEVARPVDAETWKKAKALEQSAVGLEPPLREALYREFGDADLVFHARSVSLLRAVSALPEDKQESFLKQLEVPEDLKKQVKALLKSGPEKSGPDTGFSNRDDLMNLSALKPTETFMLSMKLSLFAGIIISFPLLLMYILQFVLPGLHAHEKKVLWPAMAVGFGLFLLGVCFAYFGVLPRALLFFSGWSGSLGVSNDWRIGEYISFASQFTLLFGLSFELPVVVMVFVKLGLLSYETMSRTRSYAIVGIFVAAAVLTPTPDIFTLTLMALPMALLYEICIWLAWLDRRKNRMQEEQDAREREERLLAAPHLAGAAMHEDTAASSAVAEDGEEKKSEDGYEESWKHDEHHYSHDSTSDAADDGWVTEYPQQDYHDSEMPQTDEIPEIPRIDAEAEPKAPDDSTETPTADGNDDGEDSKPKDQQP
jgi:sec-independent protein translocase protein TatC